MCKQLITRLKCNVLKKITVVIELLTVVKAFTDINGAVKGAHSEKKTTEDWLAMNKNNPNISAAEKKRYEENLKEFEQQTKELFEAQIENRSLVIQENPIMERRISKTSS